MSIFFAVYNRVSLCTCGGPPAPAVLVPAICQVGVFSERVVFPLRPGGPAVVGASVSPRRLRPLAAEDRSVGITAQIILVLSVGAGADRQRVPCAVLLL